MPVIFQAWPKLFSSCTGSRAHTIPDPDALQEKGAQLFADFGGMDQVAQMLPLMG
jgi:hypothetical protein